MNEVLRFLRLEGVQTDALPVWEALFAICVAALCSCLISLVYRWTHQELAYSPSYVRTLVLVSMVTALIMVVIGSNIARAFSLVGALSIIRFRNAVKETRDVGFIFFSMAVAMASGTRFYLLALAGTALISVIMLVVHHFDFGGRTLEPERLLRLRLPAGTDPMVVLDAPFAELFVAWSLILLETVQQGLAVDAVFSVRRKDGVSAAKVIERLQALDENPKVTYHLGFDVDEI
ncbi:MAG: DUF4956 domain-containing protein [Vulcanimicrobiota bacterium]